MGSDTFQPFQSEMLKVSTFLDIQCGNQKAQNFNNSPFRKNTVAEINTPERKLKPSSNTQRTVSYHALYHFQENK